jgi:alpha-ketoglutarate-dependent taurine dioxygenase
MLLAHPPGQDLRELPLGRLRELGRAQRLVVLRGFRPLDRADLAAYCRRWGDLLVWNFGVILDLVVHDAPKNYLFTAGNVPYHWDGAFAEAVPSWQLFQCLQAPLAGRGGETLFCDTTRLWNEATPEQRARWQGVSITYTTEKVAHYGGRVTAGLVGKHPATGAATLRYAEPPDGETAPLNPLGLEVHGLSAEEASALLGELRALLYDPRYCYAHAWQDGDFLLADNHALLHGRRPFSTHSPRHIQRVHVL